MSTPQDLEYSGWLVMSRSVGEMIQIGDAFLVINELKGSRALVAIHAPKGYKINRLDKEQESSSNDEIIARIKMLQSQKD